MQKKRERVLFVLVAALLASFLFFACGQKKESVETDRILSVTRTGEGLEVCAELTDVTAASAGNGIVYLFALLPGESVSSLDSCAPVAESDAASQLRFTVPADKDGAILYAKFVLAVRRGESYTAVTTAAYPSFEQEGSSLYSPAGSKKGIVTENLGEAESLFAAHTMIDLDVESLITTGSGLRCGIGEESWLLSESRIDSVDYLVRNASSAGIRVYLRLLLPENARAVDALRYAAVSGFFAERYSGGEKGIVKDFILAFEGGTPSRDIYNTAALLRAVYTAVSLSSENARLFYSVSCLFNSSGVDGGSRALLDSLFAALSYNGEIPFGIALDMSAVSRLPSPVWEEPLASDSLNTVYLTVRNLSLFTDYLSREEFLTNGKERPVIILGFSVPCDNSEGSEDRQAAAVAYAYYKVLAEDSVEAFFYSQLFDSSVSASGLIRADGTHRRSYELFRALDTEQGTAESSFALPLIGVNRWQAVTGKELSAPVYFSSVHITADFTEPTGRHGLKKLFDFSSGSLGGLYPSQGAVSLALRVRDDEPVRAVCNLDGNSSESACGVSAALPALSAETKQIALTLTAAGEGKNSVSHIIVELSGYDSTVRRFWETDFELPDGADTTVYLDLSNLTKKEITALNRIRVLRENDGMPATLSVIALDAIEAVPGFFTVLLRTLLVLVCIAAIGLFVLWLRMILLRRRAALRRRRRNEAVNPKPKRRARF